jgi:peptide/nickel transport system substrate-binding protein
VHAGPAYIQTITFRIIPEYSTQLAGLESGEIDFVNLQIKDLARIQALKKHQIVSIGVAGAGIHLEMNTTKAPYDDVRVRQAINYAIDRDQIIKVVELGNAQPLYGPLTPATLGYWPGVEYIGYRFNLAKAKALMTEAGYVAGADGVLQKDGKPLAPVLVFSSDTQKVAEIVQQQLKALGVKLELKQMEYGVLTKTLSAGEYEIGMDILGWPDAGLLYVMFHSATIGAYNHVRVKALDGLIINFVISVGPAAFAETAGAIQKKAVEDAYFAPIYAEMSYSAISNRIQGPLYSPAARWLYLFDAYIETGPM